MNPPKLSPVAFHSHTLLTFQQEGQPYVVMKPIVEALGLAWHGQFERVQRNPVLAQAIRIIRMQMSGDDQHREYVALPLKLLNGWLFGIDANRVKPEIREAILMYQRECYDALFAYWHLGEARNPRRSEVGKQVRRAINARAWALSQANYETYKALMLAAVPLDEPASLALVEQWAPPAMLPAAAFDEAIAKLQQARAMH